MAKKTKTVLAFSFVALASLAAFAVIVNVLRSYNRDAQYTLIVSPNGSTIATRSDKPDHSAGPFQLEGEFTAGTFRLGTDHNESDVYNVTFSDTTLRPGRIRLTIGDSNVDLIPSRVNVDGKDYQWTVESKHLLNPAQ